MAGQYHVEIETDVVFGEGGGRNLRCDVYRPKGTPAPLPAVILVHGGGWRQGDRTQLKGYGVLIGREGYVCIAPEYRLLGESPWPAQLDDLRAAYDWARKHADDLGIDPERIAVEGNSAGAHLALLLAADETRPVKACIAVYPPVLLKHGEHEPGATPMMAIHDDGGSPDFESELSPLRQAGPHFPPTKLIHGAKDELVPVEASFRMYEELHSHGVPVDLHVYADQPHAFDAVAPFGRQSAREMVLFLQRYC